MLKMTFAFAEFTCFYFDGLSDRMRDFVTVACHCGRRTDDCGRLTPPPRRHRRRAAYPDRRVTTRGMRWRAGQDGTKGVTVRRVRRRAKRDGTQHAAVRRARSDAAAFKAAARAAGR